MDGDDEEKTIISSEQLLSDLMTALATGARAVQGLPIDDEYEYQSSYPEFRRSIEESQESLLDVLLMTLEDVAAVLPSSTTTITSDINFDSLDDPLLWETCTDLCDALLEQAERISSSSSIGDNTNNQLTKDLRNARNYAQSSFGRLLNGIVDMEKPQVVYKFRDSPSTSNDRTRVFVPPFLQKKFFPKEELDLDALKESGHGLDTKLGQLKSTTSVSRIPPNIVAPSHHIRHAYTKELDELEYPDWELEAPATKLKIEKDDDDLVSKATWVDSSDALLALKNALESPNIREVAVDLEAHSYRCFAGMICLIQITIEDPDTNEKKDYLIDPFPIWNLIHNALGPTLANPQVVKIFHGADSDISWLQRDFGLFVVNMFDTGRAARALQLPSHGFAHVLQRYVDGVQADKSHQLSDWRQRPLPEAMKEYAIMDTHYLIDIYRSMKFDLSKSKITSIQDVLEDSRKVCTITFRP